MSTLAAVSVLDGPSTADGLETLLRQRAIVEFARCTPSQDIEAAITALSERMPLLVDRLETLGCIRYRIRHASPESAYGMLLYHGDKADPELREYMRGFSTVLYDLPHLDGASPAYRRGYADAIEYRMKGDANGRPEQR